MRNKSSSLLLVLAKTVNNYTIVFVSESTTLLIASFSDSSIHITVERHI